jgi:hypothetical protein
MKKILGMLAITALCGVVNVSALSVNYNDTITAIYGGGNPDNGWLSTTLSDGTVLALQAKNRDNGAVPNNGDGSWSFAPGFSTITPSRSLWNMQWSVSTPGALLTSGYNYTFSMTGPGGYSVSFPISALLDNSYGTSSTPNGQGAESIYALAGSSTVAQNSWNNTFLGGSATLPGDYITTLTRTPIIVPSFSPSAVATPNSISGIVHIGVQSVPETGSTAAALALGLGSLAVPAGFLRRKQRLQVAS